MADRFPELSENDLTSLVDRKNSENKRCTQRISRVSQGKKGRRRVTRVIDGKDKLTNAYVLKRFYAEARKKNGELYTKASLVGICFENCEILQLC